MTDVRTVQNGQPFTVTLEERLSTGYTWTLEPPVSFSVTETLEVQDAPAGHVGGTARRTFTLTPLRPGSFHLTFRHARSRQRGAALDTHSLAVSVMAPARFEAVRVHGQTETGLLHLGTLTLPYLKAEGQVHTLGPDGQVTVWPEGELNLDPSRNAASSVVEDAGHGAVTYRTCEYRNLEHGQEIFSRAELHGDGTSTFRRS